MKRKQVILLISILVVVFSTAGVYYGFASVSIEKYPPTGYYLSYGLFVSIVLYYLVNMNKKVIVKIRESKIVGWISKNSLWIYLWHIVPVKILIEYKILVIENWVLNYFIIVFFGMVVTLICNKVTEYVKGFVLKN